MDNDEKTNITYHYIKNSQCTDHYVTGAYGGIDINSGRLTMAVFSERPAIPKTVEVIFDSAGKKIEETPKGLDGDVRSISAVLHYDINTAISIHAWLSNKIENFKAAHPENFEDETDGSN